MAKVFLIIAIVLTGVTAILGYVTKTKVDDLGQSLKDSRVTVSGLRGDKTKLTADLKKSNEDLTAANKTVDDQKDQLTQAATALAASKADDEKDKATIEEDEKKVTDITADRDRLQDIVAKVNPNNVDPATLATMKEENDHMKTELAEARQVQDTLKERERESSEKAAAVSKQLAVYKNHIMRNGLSGRVIAVNKGWNFVVLDLGDRRGAVVNAPMLVMRGGQPVARLKITSVEPTTSIADVEPGSMNRGQAVQPGDTVVYAGRSAETQQPADEAPAGGAAPGANSSPSAPPMPTSASN